MKPRFTLLAIAAAGVLGVICFFQWRQIVNQQSTVDALHRSLAVNTQLTTELRASKEFLNQQRRALLAQTETQAIELQAERAAATTNRLPGGLTPPGDQAGKPIPPEGGLGKFFSKMFEDPQTKGFIREQQRMVMDQLYAPLVKQLGLTSEVGNKLKDLLSDHAMKSTESASALLNTTNRTELMTTLSGDKAQLDHEIRELLGEEGFASYNEYQSTVGERMQLNLFRQQMGDPGSALTDQQTAQLLTFMKEEKENSSYAGHPVLSSRQDPSNLQAILGDDQTEALLETQAGLNERVYERAKHLLTPDQLQAFGKFQTSQLQMMRLGMSMARKFIGGNQAPGNP